MFKLSRQRSPHMQCVDCIVSPSKSIGLIPRAAGFIRWRFFSLFFAGSRGQISNYLKPCFQSN